MSTTSPLGALVFLAWPVKKEYTKKGRAAIKRLDMTNTENIIRYLRTEYESDPNGKDGQFDEESDMTDESDEESDVTDDSDEESDVIDESIEDQDAMYESSEYQDAVKKSGEKHDATNESRMRVIAKIHIHKYPDSTSPREMRVECRSQRFPVFAMPRIAEWDDAGVKIKQVERCQCKRKAIKLPVDNKPKSTG
ncbi:SDA1 domain-containing protein [Pochonia chlamydosporia 170]|uniref:SDA1 domain-containing protein n=1 Tax=Pochonia chlamydosporia 170 TaxID=1380566 RepID=A0A179FBJ1_METCM|nr:SDA1 domain-containing protein [Pochonia chlamydosporia 170]OAQ62443.1 SDA1 domain-containing protein [Pochonia chlamydosporia 170]